MDMFPFLRLSEIVGKANFFIRLLHSDYPDLMKSCHGGYLCISRKCDGRPLLIMQIGECLPEKVDRHLESCQEKAWRLSEHGDVLSSFQTNTDSKQQYAGAVIAGAWIISFSGLPTWKADEALSLYLAQYFNLIARHVAEEIARISDNELAYV